MGSSQLKLEPKEEEDLKECLKKHDENKNHLHLVELAGTVGDIAAQEKKSDALLNFLMDRLTELKQEEHKQPKNSFSFDFFVKCWKVVLALGILVASQEKPGKQKDLLDDSLLKIVKDKDKKDRDFPWPNLCSRLALSELTYVDQYLHSFTDKENTHAEKKINVRRYCKEKILKLCKNDPWASPIRDYVMNIEAWDVRTKFSRKIPELEEEESQKLPEMYAICSVKGGVGKTITAIGLFNHLEQNMKKKVLLIDVDISGPTLQFHLNIPNCVKALSAVPSPQNPPQEILDEDEDEDEYEGSFVWSYPSFSSVYQVRNDDSKKMTEAQKAFLSISHKESFLKISPPSKGRVVCLPDSPTLCGRLDTDLRWEHFREYVALQKTLSPMLETAKKQRFDYVILDFSPGLVGRNGPILRWLCEHYRTRLLLVSSTRAPDLATALYDGTWAAAEGEFKWYKSVVHLINMWPEEQQQRNLNTIPIIWLLLREINSIAGILFLRRSPTLEKVLEDWTEDFAVRAIRTNLKSAWNSNTSASQIYFWRMWCYLYLHGIKKRSKRMMRIGYLPRDKDLTEMLSVPIQSEAEFKIDDNKLLQSRWMTKLLEAFPDEPWGSRKSSK